MVIGGVNPDGALSKMTTIKKAIRETGSAVWMMQETKVSQAGKIKLDGYVTYEHVRKDKEGGGLSISVKKELGPALVRDGGDDAEALTVNIHLKKITISCNTAYGPQEYASVEKKESFWKYLEEEAERAKKEGNGFILQGDLNAWLGPEIIPGDNRKQNQNGKMLVNFVKTNQLRIVNSLNICTGTTTWKRVLKGIEVKSTLDYFVVCENVLPFINKMVIDTDKKHTLTNFYKVKRGEKATNADHTPMWIEMKLKISPDKPEKVEMLNFNDENARKLFKINTTETKSFTNCFKSKEPLKTQVENWTHLVEQHCKKVFPKIRIRRRHIQPSKADALVDRRNTLIKVAQEEDCDELQDLNVKIAQIISEEERLKCHKLKDFCNKDGSMNVAQMWKVKKRLWPKKQTTLPAAKINHMGNLVSTPKDVKKAMQKEYKERLRLRPKHPGITKVYKKKTISMKLKLSKLNKSPPITMKELTDVLKTTKAGKARDTEGWARELFKPETIGSDLKESMLTMFNLIKENGEIPKLMRKANISTIPKKNKPRLYLKNERGIFLVNSIRGIFMRILFNRKSEAIDDNMSDSNIGGRKDKSCINHIWVLNGIIHEQLSSVKNKPIILQQYDYVQMFDGMELGEALSDLHNAVKDDTLHLLYEANKNIEVRVKTPFGLTEAVVLDSNVLQGEVWGPSLASNQVDTMGKDLLENEDEYPFIYKYKGHIPVGILGQVDDTIGVTEAGFKASQLNSYMNVRSADKYLQFGHDKCQAMVVGKRVESFHIPTLEVDTWEVKHDNDGNLIETFGGKKPMEMSQSLSYLGVKISANGKNMDTILDKRNKQLGNRKQINSLLKGYGKYRFECGKIFLNSLVRNSILYGTEVMYNMSEREYREIERIEEGQMKAILEAKTGIQVPTHLMYLDFGELPARYIIKRFKMNYLQYILHQKESSLLYRMLQAQKNKPVRGDWFTEVTKLLEEFKINITIEEIQKMDRKGFRKMTKQRTEEKGFADLILRQQKGKKGNTIKYGKSVSLADYLCPNNLLDVKDQQEIFQIRTGINPLPANRGSHEPCPTGCGKDLNNEHILECEKLNSEKKYKFDKIINGNLIEQKEMLKIWRENLKKIEEIKKKI